MAINEACQLWIEQRIQEELDDRGDTGKSLREIGREIAAEIERVFEAKVKPETIKSKVLRAAGSNEPEPPTPQDDCGKCGNTGNKLNPQDVVREIDIAVENGASVREAAKIVAEKHGKNPGSLRVTYAREKERGQTPREAIASYYATRAIQYLNMIPDNHPKRVEAFTEVLNWINKHIGG